MRCVLGIITDGKKILLLRKNNPDWQRGLYNGIGGKVDIDSTPIDTIIKISKEEIGLDILNWNELETIILANGVELTYLLSLVDEEQIKKAKSLTDERLEIFNIDKLPRNIIKDFKEQLNKIFFKMEEKNNKIKKILISTLVVVLFLITSLMVIGKVTKGNFLYYLTKEKAEEDMDKKIQFKKGFTERIFGTM
ncbi:NUDIX domain-containing protein [Arcobacter sp. CECT 9188]|uniref:NUDIX domain-containing protein n=1 Tax=Arcobacter sp. CECT 9188 TaxID=2044505 RepID=UPI000DEB3D17|nr:NUDIX domain-containing protein [Arcobacter sp. CECT 9188]RBQ26309.1 NUDIX domain-containing protein [Arcobacter sp. CECT 9188]